MKYSDIRDLDSLNKALKSVSEDVRMRGRNVVSSWEEAKEAYSPVNLLAAGIKSASSSIPLDKIVIFAVRLLRRFFR